MEEAVPNGVAAELQAMQQVNRADAAPPQRAAAVVAPPRRAQSKRPVAAAAAAEERRIDAADGLAYTKADFLAEYGGTREWEAAAPAAVKEPERRIDPADGVAYTRDEFVAEYGGTREWESAKRAPTRTTAPQPPQPSGPSAAQQKESARLLEEQTKRESAPELAQMLKVRRNLPAHGSPGGARRAQEIARARRLRRDGLRQVDAGASVSPRGGDGSVRRRAVLGDCHAAATRRRRLARATRRRRARRTRRPFRRLLHPPRGQTI